MNYPTTSGRGIGLAPAASREVSNLFTPMNIALILAGGSGTRMNLPLPKQYAEILGKPVIEYTLQAFLKHPQIDAVYVVCSEDGEKYIKQTATVRGGATRQESALFGLRELAKRYPADSVVLIHDAARPLVSEDIITENVSKTKLFDCAVTAINSTNSIAEISSDGLVSRYLNRDSLIMLQTPQTFRLSAILEAHERAAASGESGFTDDNSLFMKYFPEAKCAVASGNSMNFKITEQADLLVLRNHLTRGVIDI